jgi:hypothetical protein
MPVIHIDEQIQRLFQVFQQFKNSGLDVIELPDQNEELESIQENPE